MASAHLPGPFFALFFNARRFIVTVSAFLPIFISSCGFGFIRTRAPIRRFVSSSSDLDLLMTTPRHYGKKWSGEYYPASLTDHIHALGIVAANYNTLESSFYSLFCEYFGISANSAALFAQFKNNFRIDTLKVVVEKYEKDPAVADAVFHFLKCYNICADNRNVLMHSLMDAHDQIEPDLVAKKPTRNNPEKFTNLHFSLSALRKAADELWSVELYCGDIYMFLLTRRGDIPPADPYALTALPAKPALPDILSLLHRASAQVLPIRP